MDLLRKIEKLKNTLNNFENIVEELGDNIISKQEKINHLKEQIEKNIKKIDEIIQNSDADS
tara:strand:+ start:1750 stop:1932 length:183 start_codon:yes stop_codon:yes gene_type:complete